MSGRVGYVLPLRWTTAADERGLPELTGYLRWLAGHVADVLVVDASPAPLYARHAEAWRGLVRHLRPDPDLRYRNGKVNGVTTGLRHAAAERVVIADDDVRYDGAGLAAVAAALAGADLVRPQNYFDPLSWHARWDTARSLLNRAAGADYPGTYGVRRSTFLAMGGYDGDVLFENLELSRTVRAHGGVEARRRDLYVRRLPPPVGKFLGQRVRQAYDDLAQPARMAAFLAVLPALAAGAAAAPARAVLAVAGAAAVGTVAAAELGRRRAGGRAVFPVSASLLAPAWVLERACCSWLALGRRLRGGVPYAGNRIVVAAHRTGELGRNAGRSATLAAAGCVETRQPV
ncbi:MAG: glycosyltransferase [Mycobacteriales bacterium]